MPVLDDKKYVEALAGAGIIDKDSRIARQILRRQYYLLYRRKVSEAGPTYRRNKDDAAVHFSPDMVFKRNVLASKLAVRPQMKPQPFSLGPVAMRPQLAKYAQELHGKKFLADIRQQKEAMNEENRKKAEAALGSFLRSGGETGALQDELEFLAGHIFSFGLEGATYGPGPIKLVEKAMKKTKEDYGYGWGDNKDLVRGTVVVKRNDDLKMLIDKLVEVSRPENGIGLVKKEEKKSTRDGGKDAIGYSDWNFALQFQEHRFACEMQANSAPVIYGKSKKSEFLKMTQSSESEYGKWQTAMQFPGGLGHTFYDIFASHESSSDERKQTQDLSLDYYDACRGNFRFGNTVNSLNQRINAFGKSLTSEHATKHWKKAVSESGWTVYPFA